MKKKGEAAARPIFLKLHANSEGVLDEFMEREYQEMKLAIEYDKAHKVRGISSYRMVHILTSACSWIIGNISSIHLQHAIVPS